MTRTNEKESHNAGARFISICKKLFLVYEMMIFTSNEEKAKTELEKLKVPMERVKITIKTNDAVKFLLFE